jgi:aryl-alcohol dehydrogenase-like predicted oxidoreductase
LTMNDLTWLKEKLLTEENIDKVIKLQTIANDLNTSLANLAIAWCLKNNHVSTVITGATKLSQLQENLKSIDVVEKLNDSVMESIESVLNNAPKKPQY